MTRDKCHPCSASCLTKRVLPVSKVGWWVAEDMARRLSMATRRELKEAIGQCYRAAGRWKRRQILDVLQPPRPRLAGKD